MVGDDVGFGEVAECPLTPKSKIYTEGLAENGGSSAN